MNGLQRYSTREIIAWGAIAIIVGVGAWVLVEALQPRHQDQAGTEVLRPLDFPPHQSRDKQSDSSEEVECGGHSLLSPEAEVEESVGTGVRRLPVIWGTRPEEFPRDGIPAVLHALGGGDTSEFDCAFFAGHIEVPADLPDGRYGWKRTSRLYFPVATEVIVVVTNGEITMRPRFPGANIEAVVVYYRVPVRLYATISATPQATVDVRCTPKHVGRGGEYNTSVSVRHGSEVIAHVPRGPLSFRKHGTAYRTSSEVRQLPTSFDTGLVSSLENRVPKENERIELTISEGGKLVVNLVESKPRDLWRVFGELAENGGIDNISLRVHLNGWGGNDYALQLEGEWLVRPSRRMNAASIEVDVPPVARSCSVALYVSYQLPGRFETGPGEAVNDGVRRLTSGRSLAHGKATLSPGERHYHIDAQIVAHRWTVEYFVRDRNGNPAKDFAVSIDEITPVSAWRGRTHRGRTGSDGRIVFDELAAVRGFGVRPQFELNVPRDLNPDLKRTYWYEGIAITQVKIVVESAPTPLRFVFDSSMLSEGGAWRPKIHYLVLPRAVEGNVDCDIEQARVDKDLRLITSVRQPGRYTALMRTPVGQIYLDEFYYSPESPEVSVRVQVGHRVRISCRDADGNALTNPVIFPAQIDHSLAWALGVARSRGHIRILVPSPSSGIVTQYVQSDHADAAQWTIYHSSIGLFRPGLVSGSIEEGLVLTGAKPLPSGSIDVMTEGDESSEGQYEVCLSPVFTESGGEIRDVFVWLSEMQTIKNERAAFANVPPGRYVVTVIHKTERGYFTKGPEWTRFVNVSHDQAVELTLP